MCAGFADDSSGFDVVYADNVDFTGGATPVAQMVTDGQLLIGNTAGSPHIRMGTLTSSSSTLTITYSAPNINLEVSNGGSTGAVTKVLGDDGGGNSVVPLSGMLNWTGITVTNATNAKPVFFKKNGTNTEELDVQLATTSTSGTKNINKSGLAHFDSAAFTVDAATGFIGLVGGSSAPTLGLVPDAHTAPGTTPVVPNGSGNITLEGGITFATGTQANPIRTNSLAANTIDLQIQLAGSNAGASTANNFGVSQFDSNQFLVTSGFVQLKGDGTAPALTKLAMDAGTSPVVPDSTGQITLTAAQVATGVVGANVIRSDGTGANTCTLQIQRSTVAGASNSALNGVCHFSSTSFGVDTNGFVTFVGAPGVFPWSDKSTSFNASSNNGYFITANATATMPATPNNGDVIRFVVTAGSTTVTITASGSQTIRLGTVVSAAAGTCANTKQGDAINLVFRSTDSVWYAYEGAVGSWLIT